jgi:ribonuclease BN (tRNA processing enzyme)
VDVRFLGSGGWLPTDRRETACILLTEGEDALLLDAGTGMRRLVTEPSLLDGIERLHVALTHFHTDHTFGLIALPGLRGFCSMREIWAPGRSVAGVDADTIIHRLLDPPFLGDTPARVTREWLTGIHELEGTVEIGPFRVETRLQPKHNGPTVALRVNGELAYCTDTAYDEENADFARGARVLLHEAMLATDTTEDPIHSAAGEAARIAAAAEVERLVLCHVNPTPGSEDGLVEMARERFEASDVAEDGMTL